MGVIKAVIFDWSGTVADFGSRAPAEAFTDRGTTTREGEAREPMGLERRHHVAFLARLPRIAAARRHVHGHDIKPAEFDGLDRRIDKGRPVPLHETGARHVIDTVADLPRALDDIAECLAQGRTPHHDRENGR